MTRVKFVDVFKSSFWKLRYSFNDMNALLVKFDIYRNRPIIIGLSNWAWFFWKFRNQITQLNHTAISIFKFRFQADFELLMELDSVIFEIFCSGNGNKIAFDLKMVIFSMKVWDQKKIRRFFIVIFTTVVSTW